MKINRSGNPNLDPRSWDKLKIRRGWGGFWEAYINGIGPLEHRLFKEECLDKVIAMHAGGDRDRIRPRPRGALPLSDRAAASRPPTRPEAEPLPPPPTPRPRPHERCVWPPCENVKYGDEMFCEEHLEEEGS